MVRGVLGRIGVPIQRMGSLGGGLGEAIILRRVASLPSEPLPGPFTNGPYGGPAPSFKNDLRGGDGALIDLV